jgi:hypothetical protein
MYRMQRPLPLIAPDVPFYWGAETNGGSGMQKCFVICPRSTKDRPRIWKLPTMMKSLKEYQNPKVSGISCSKIPNAGLKHRFCHVYLPFKGVKTWLDAKEYAPAARKAWMALVTYLTEKNQVREICVGTNKKNDKQYYYDRPRRTGDFHAQGPYLWCVVALMEK